jgi:hypothetical protein
MSAALHKCWLAGLDSSGSQTVMGDGCTSQRGRARAVSLH